jgi:ArsR family transcriptional regulator
VCVCDLTDAFDLTGPTISHHLRVLRGTGLVECNGTAPGSTTGPGRAPCDKLAELLAAAPVPARRRRPAGPALHRPVRHSPP